MGTHLLSNPGREGRPPDGGNLVFRGVEIAAPLEIVDRGQILEEGIQFGIGRASTAGCRAAPAATARGLIQTVSGTAGGVGGLRTKRSGWAVYAAASTSARWARTASAWP